jgi:triosephosphate isomerase
MTTHARRKFVVANWKMHTTASEAQQLAKGIVEGLKGQDHVTVILCPPFPYLGIVRDILKESNVFLGAQNMYPAADGAFTGEVSPSMLLDLGCRYVILGHSERRHKLGESDAFINEKVTYALAVGLSVILCVGETLAERIAMRTEEVLDRQLTKGLAGVPPEALYHLSIAYEPVWAIGNEDHHATPQQAHDAHVLIRRKLDQMFGKTWARNFTVQYGGSVEPDNAAAFLRQDGIDGVLIGGASLKADEFLAIVQGAISEVHIEMQTALNL